MNHHGDWSHSGKGDPLWLSDADEGYLEATLVSVQGDKIIVEDKGGKVRVCIRDFLHDGGFRCQSGESQGVDEEGNAGSSA